MKFRYTGSLVQLVRLGKESGHESNQVIGKIDLLSGNEVIFDGYKLSPNEKTQLKKWLKDREEERVNESTQRSFKIDMEIQMLANDIKAGRTQLDLSQFEQLKFSFNQLRKLVSVQEG